MYVFLVLANPMHVFNPTQLRSHLPDVFTGRIYSVHQLPIIRHQKEPRRGFVQAAYRRKKGPAAGKPVCLHVCVCVCFCACMCMCLSKRPIKDRKGRRLANLSVCVCVYVCVCLCACMCMCLSKRPIKDRMGRHLASLRVRVRTHLSVCAYMCVCVHGKCSGVWLGTQTECSMLQ